MVGFSSLFVIVFVVRSEVLTKRTLLSCQQIRQKVTLQTKTASRADLEAVLRGGDGES